ncbi:MAG TPA: SDR family NAD(P)-dependent oxidoreductase [Thermomicrobiaceae bacterium]|nr:SDR family NAD(P)-dependent oxidoreductase [Thermomicrobiaceae bacterium]
MATESGLAEWAGRLAVVTGAASGIGAAVATGLAARGCRVIAADVDRDGLERLRAGTPAGSGEVVPLALDVADWDAVAAATRTILDRHGAPHYLVPDAGVNPRVASSGEVDEAFWDRVMGVNLKGLFATCRGFIPAMADAGRGAVVNLASVSGLVGWGGSSVYCASKGGIIALTRALATEYAGRGVRVNCVCPGSVRTPMVVNNLLARGGDVEAGLAASARQHPLGRVAEPGDVAAAILFLLSEQAAFITGSVMTVDGGLTAV